MTDELRQELETLTGQMKAAIQVMDESKTADGGRWQTADAERQALTEKLNVVSEKIEAKEREEATAKATADMNAFLSNHRAPSMAATIGSSKATSTGIEPGDFIGAVVDAKSHDYEVQNAAKAKLNEMGVRHQESKGKAVLGTTDATGGWLIPNAQVADFIKPATFTSPYRQLMTVITGVNSPTVDQPFRIGGPARAVIAPIGDTKENVNLVYNGYTATMYTLARIYDVANQFLRYSRGAAEQDILQELGTAFALGESYYVREGSGSSEPFGYTSALTNGPAAYRSTFSPATTRAGSIATAITVAAGALEGRGEIATGVVLSSNGYWTMASQGTEEAGFFFSPAGGPTDIRPGTLMTPWGIPVYRDVSSDAVGTAAVVDNLVIANWPKFKLYFGDSYRVDSSSEAGTRWDTNLTGFRGEEEMGFDARPAVYSGAAQMITDILP